MSEVSIDSFKIRIPISEVEIVSDSIFGTKYIVDAETHDIESEFHQKKYAYRKDGVTVSFGLETQVTANQKIKDYLVILINAKLLYEDYLDGISSSNIGLVYQRIINLDLVKFSKLSFMNGSVTDLDLKLDAVNEDFDKTLKLIYGHAKPSKVISQGCNLFDKRTNKGIEFGKRETAKPSSPFLKFYHKQLELLSKSRKFHNKYLLGVDISNLVRVETTIKNKKHFAKYGIKETSLASILDVPQETLYGILKESIRIHLEPRLVVLKSVVNMKPQDVVYYNAMSLLMNQGNSYNTVRETLVQGINNASSKTNTRVTLDRIYNEVIRGSEVDVVSEKQDEYFNLVGWV